MNLAEFEVEFLKLGNNYKTKDLDKFSRSLIKKKEDVTFLKDLVLIKDSYHRVFFQVSLAQQMGIKAKFEFIEQNFDKLQDWWHVDQLSQFVRKDLIFDFAYEKAKQYVKSELPFVRRWGYVLFIPKLVKDLSVIEKILLLFKDDEAYYVQMAQAWLISSLAVYAPEKMLKYLTSCSLHYNIVGKAIQKINDSFRISKEYKTYFKEIRNPDNIRYKNVFNLSF